MGSPMPPMVAKRLPVSLPVWARRMLRRCLGTMPAKGCCTRRERAMLVTMPSLRPAVASSTTMNPMRSSSTRTWSAMARSSSEGESMATSSQKRRSTGASSKPSATS